MEDRWLLPRRDSSRSIHKWALYRGANLHELDAQLISLTRNQKRPHLQKECVPVALNHEYGEHDEFVSVAVVKKNMFGLFRQSLLSKGGSTEGKNRKADGFTALKRITSLRRVNSEAHSCAFSQNGSLKWVHGTMSEKSWGSH